MRKIILAVVVAGMILMTGCVSLLSLSPLATGDNVIFDPAVVGAWMDDMDGKETYLIVPDGDKAYEVVYTSKGDPALKFQGSLVDVNGIRILDLQSRPTIDDFSIPGHFFAHVRVEGDSLYVAFMESRWIREQVKRERLGMDLSSDRVVLTASSEELGSFVARHAGDPEAFNEEGKLRRIR